MDVLQTLHQLLDTTNAIRQALDFQSYPARFIAANLATVVEALRAFVFSTGDPFDPGHDFIQSPAIRELMPLTQAAADAGLTAAVVWGFFRIMWARSVIRSQHVLRLMLPRACLAVVLINFAPLLMQSAVEASNALTQAVLNTSPGDHVKAIQGWFNDTAAPGLHVVVMLALFISYGLLGLVYVMRFALLVVLTVLAPVAALLFVLPDTHRFARNWGNLFAITLLMQPLQLMILQVGFSLDASFESITSYPFRHLFALCTAYMTFKVPGALNTSTRVGTRAQTIAKREINHAYKNALKALAKVKP
ncbi:MAG: hypothetical protein J2P45_00850 [Candidatus Dormibacteraeota bacterium]|nr:hypothetical protein [Candidatus Dormibacteraeota bacterium]